MEVTLVATAPTSKDIWNYDITLDGDAIGSCQIRRTLSKSAGMPDGFENNVFFGLFPGSDDRPTLESLFGAMQHEAQNIGVAELVGILAAEETSAAHALELLGAEISNSVQTLDGHLIRKFVLSQVHNREAGEIHERRSDI
jgi:hypothetical protein